MGLYSRWPRPASLLMDFQLLDDQATPTVEHEHPFSPMDIIPNSDSRQAQGLSRWWPGLVSLGIVSMGLYSRWPRPASLLMVSIGRRQAQQSRPMDTINNEAGLGQREYSPMDTMPSETCSTVGVA
jgi:hypothetical protein